MQADLSLIRDYSPEDNTVWRPVAINHFHGQEKDLYYVNARHPREQGIHIPTRETVRAAVENYQPQLAIIEGLPTEAGVSPASYVAYAKRQSEQNFAHGEPGYTAFLAHQNGIPFVGGEPSEKEICAGMQDKGYSAKDVISFYLLRSIPQAKAQGVPVDEPEDFAKYTEKYINDWFDFLPPRNRLTLDEFKTWYAAHKDGDTNFLDIKTDDLAPYNTPDATYFQRMSRQTSVIRDRHLATLIAESLEKNDRVLAVYGDGHLVKSRAVFENMLGPGEAIQIVDQPSPQGNSAFRPGFDPRKPQPANASLRQ